MQVYFFSQPAYQSILGPPLDTMSYQRWELHAAVWRLTGSIQYIVVAALSDASLQVQHQVQN